MGPMSRLRTIAGTFLVTSLLWGAGLFWWRDMLPQPVALQGSATATTAITAQTGRAAAAYRPVAIVPPDPADIPPLVIPVQGVQRGQLMALSLRVPR